MKRLVAVVFCLLVLAAPAAAQGTYPPTDMFPGILTPGNFPGNPYTLPPTGGPSCNPYHNLLGCAAVPLPENHSTGTFVSSYDFPQVFVGVECLPPSEPGSGCNPAPNDYLTYVSLKNQSNDPSVATVTVTWEGAASVTRLFAIAPQARISAKLNDWPEIPRDQIGVTVEVRMAKKGTAGIGMHSARDFWRTFTILEGR